MGNYTRSSKTRYYTHEENLKFQSDIRTYYLEVLRERHGRETPGCVLLDSSLISRTNIKRRDVKIIQCGNYYQIYTFSEKRPMIDKTKEKLKDKKYSIKKMLSKESGGEELQDMSNIDTDLLISQNKKPTLKNIEEKNIRRSKSQLQRIVKSNESVFKTFLTLTYADNISDIAIANKQFDNWRRSVKRKKANFKYVCVPEFQKRGAVHYHLLTNLDINEDCDIIIPQKEFTEKQLTKMSEEQRKKCYDVKYWNKGYSSVFPTRDINVVGYMSKYMTKDIDKRLWGKRRYLYSQNLKSPITVYLDLDDIEDFRHFVDIVNSSNLNYKSVYADINGELIEFEEYKLKECI